VEDGQESDLREIDCSEKKSEDRNRKDEEGYDPGEEGREEGGVAEEVEYALLTLASDE
jgi:hypothetical protein